MIKTIDDLKPYMGKEVRMAGRTWKIEHDWQPNTCLFMSKGAQVHVYATPGHEDTPLPIEIVDEDGEVKTETLPTYPKDFEDFINMVRGFVTMHVSPDGTWREERI